MRILDDESNKKVESVSILLTRKEAIQMNSYLDEVIANPELQHFHLSSEDYQKEITISIYDPEDLEKFHPRFKRLIIQDE